MDGVNRDQVDRTSRLIRQAARRSRRREWLGRLIIIVWLVAAGILAVKRQWIAVPFLIIFALRDITVSYLEEMAFRMGFLSAQAKTYRILINSKVEVNDELVGMLRDLMPPTFKEAKQDSDVWMAVHYPPPDKDTP